MPIAPHHLDWLAIRLAADMTRPRFYSLMARFADPSAVLGASASDIARVRGFDAELARGVLSSAAHPSIRQHAERLAAAGYHIITRDDASYPVNLTQSSLAPPLLFVRGTLLPDDRFSIAMVGSRHATQYGRAVAAELAEGLARSGLTVVSGFARGIDGEAHNAALKAGGRTIAVLGNGLDVCYPSEHRALGERIAASGALISEYPLGTPPDRYNFPERNHVIAALSLGTIVTEAAEKSGSLITARLAVEENRFIFAVPGDITRNNSRGANSLIQQGARLIQRSRDVLIEMKDVLRGYLDEALLLEETGETPGDTAAKPSSAPKKRRMKLPSDDASDSSSPNDVPPISLPENAPPKPPPSQPSPAPATFTEEETFILDLLRHEATVFDELAIHAHNRGIDTARLTSLLMKLELRKVIRQLPGRYYVLFSS